MPHLYALHGFLGLPSDWKQIPFPPQWRCFFVDLYASHLPDPKEGLEAWADAFVSQIDPEEHNILMGYSLGGRLALHCLRAYPGMWKKAFFLSTHPGLDDEQQKTERFLQDQQWAKKFEQKPWESVMDQWNQQAVFGQSPVTRHEKDYCRSKLSQSLTGWSLAKQRDFRPFLATVPCPIVWLTGEKDQKFTRLASSLQFSHPQSQHHIIPHAGHRLLDSSKKR